MNWLYLLLAGLFEIGWTVGLKQMDNHRNGPEIYHPQLNARQP